MTKLFNLIIIIIFILYFCAPVEAQTITFSPLSSGYIIANNTAPITAPGANLTVQNSSTTASGIYATTGYSGTSPIGIYNGVTSTINVPASSTLIVNSAYGASYIDNVVFGAGQGVSAVGYSFNGIVNTPGAHGWSMVLALNDNTSGACNSSVNYCLLDGLELDFTSSSATANGTHVQGVSAILTGNAAVIGNAFEVTSRTVSQWNSAFITDDAAVSVAAINVGANVAQAANDPSQPVFFRGYDATNTAFSFELQTINHVLNFTDTTRADGISITAANGGNPVITAIGTDTNINLNLTPKGSGNVQTTANLVAQNGTATPAGGTTGAGICVGSANVCIYWGSGAPTAAATQGSIYLRTDGSSTSTRLYVNTNGSTTWTNFTSGS